MPIKFALKRHIALTILSMMAHNQDMKNKRLNYLHSNANVKFYCTLLAKVGFLEVRLPLVFDLGRLNLKVLWLFKKATHPQEKPDKTKL